eukprot:Gb_18938 [translate_table: standard]
MEGCFNLVNILDSQCTATAAVTKCGRIAFCPSHPYYALKRSTHIGSQRRALPFVFWHERQQINRLTALPRVLKTRALDAAQPFDHEAKKKAEFERKKPLTIGIIGFGNYGQFLAKTIVKQGHTVLAHSRRDYKDVAATMGVSFFRDADDFCEEHPEVILLCSSIISTEAVLRSLPMQRLKRSTLFADVLSVKEFPRQLFLEVLPAEFDILCTHPMFGPESGKAGWGGLPFVYERVRIGRGLRAERCDRFLNIFSREGCRMVQMSCAEHDRHAAESQFITHTVGRMLGKLNLESTPINTKGYEKLLQVVENTAGDSFELYYGLFMYNINATEQLERLDMAFDSLKKQLVGRLHEIHRRQLFGRVPNNVGHASPQISASTDALNNSSCENTTNGVSKEIQ